MRPSNFPFIVAALLTPLTVHATIRTTAQSQYISLDVFYGTATEPCTNNLEGWSPSIEALHDPTLCYGIEGDHNITCTSRFPSPQALSQVCFCPLRTHDRARYPSADGMISCRSRYSEESKANHERGDGASHSADGLHGPWLPRGSMREDDRGAGDV